MGQAKHNPIALAAKRGELPPKPRKMGKKEFKRKLTEEFYKRYIRPILPY